MFKSEDASKKYKGSSLAHFLPLSLKEHCPLEQLVSPDV